MIKIPYLNSGYTESSFHVSGHPERNSLWHPQQSSFLETHVVIDVHHLTKRLDKITTLNCTLSEKPLEGEA